MSVRWARASRSCRPGDAVALEVEYGAYAEMVKARAERCYGIPSGMPFDKAAALGLTY